MKPLKGMYSSRLDEPYKDEKHEGHVQQAPNQRTPTRKWTLWFLVAAVCTFWLYSNTSSHIFLGKYMANYEHDCESKDGGRVYAAAATLPPNDAGNTSTPPLDNSLTKDVQWDKYGLFIKGQRVFLWSGEIHPWRIPVTSLWLDVLQKIKASGMNAVSVYAHWGLHNPSRDVLDFDHWRDWQPFLDMAKAAGLWVVFRPGPYINAETTGGGIPGWVIAESTSDLRSNNTDYLEAWTPYVKKMSELIKANEVTNGGPIIAVQIENEYTSDPNQGPPYKPEMMEQTRRAFLDAGVTVPLTHNDAGMNGYYINGTGSPDIYGFDDYPQGFDCSHPTDWYNLTKSYHSYHTRAFPSTPLYIPELQAGAFDPWGPSSPTYDKCRILTDRSFQNNLYYHVFASNSKMINLYMMYGGTSWGNIPFPGVYTSYDYGSAIRESRDLSDKYQHLKLIGLFLRSVTEFHQTDVVSVSSLRSDEEDEVVVTHLENPTSHTGFYFVRHPDVSSNFTAKYNLNLQTSVGELKLPFALPHFTLQRRTTDLIITDLSFGASHLVYTSASVLFTGVLAGRDVLVLHGDESLGFEAILRLKGHTRRLLMTDKIQMHESSTKGAVVTILPGFKGLIEVWDSDEQLVLYCDTKTAETLYAPVIERKEKNGMTNSPFGSFWSIGTNATILIGGPHLVRRAVISGDESNELALEGDLSGDTMLRIIGAPRNIRRIVWNGLDLIDSINHAETSIITSFIRPRQEWLSISTPSSNPESDPSPKLTRVSIMSPSINTVIPSLGPWKYHDSLPEIEADFDDSDWLVAHNSTTNSPFKPYFGDGPVLYACDYGFCEGAVIWRGTFKSSKDSKNSKDDVTGVRLVINGGRAFAASVWLNGHFLKTTYGNSTRNMNNIPETDETYEFPEGILKDGSNHLVILQDNMGLEETGWPYDANESKSPRGIRGYSLLPSGKFKSWKVQGRPGGYRSVIDAHRGILNAGGLFGERQGWHLPDVPDSFNASDSSGSWTRRDLKEGLPNDSAGVGFFRTQFDLDTPSGYDVMMSFEFEDNEEELPYRALLFVNGWHMGKRIANLGPQSKFIVHEGILNYHGSNTVVVALWAMESGRNIKPNLNLVVDAKYDGGIPVRFVEAPSWQDLYGY